MHNVRLRCGAQHRHLADIAEFAVGRRGVVAAAIVVVTVVDAIDVIVAVFTFIGRLAAVVLVVLVGGNCMRRCRRRRDIEQCIHLGKQICQRIVGGHEIRGSGRRRRVGFTAERTMDVTEMHRRLLVLLLLVVAVAMIVV